MKLRELLRYEWPLSLVVLICLWIGLFDMVSSTMGPMWMFTIALPMIFLGAVMIGPGMDKAGCGGYPDQPLTVRESVLVSHGVLALGTSIGTMVIVGYAVSGVQFA